MNDYAAITKQIILCPSGTWTRCDKVTVDKRLACQPDLQHDSAHFQLISLVSVSAIPVLHCYLVDPIYFAV